MSERFNPSRAWKHFNKISSTAAECIHCGLTIVRKKSSTSRLLAHIAKHHSHRDREEGCKRLESTVPRESILSYMRRCLENLTNTDVVIHCSNGTIAAHKLVLASISQMMFVSFSISQEETTSIILPDCSTEEMSNYLDAVYSCKSLSRFHSLNQMFGLEMAVNFLPNLLQYNKQSEKIEGMKEEEESSEGDDDPENNVEGMKKEEDKIPKSQGEERKPVIISFYKKPATNGVNKVISFMKKNQSPSPGRTKSSKVWVHFDEDPEDSTKRTCKHCGHVVVSPDKSTWTMHSHIVNKHPDKVFSFSDGIILQNFQNDVVREPNPSPSRLKEVKDDSSIDPETGEMTDKSRKRKRPNPSPSRRKEETDQSSIDPETGEMFSKSKNPKKPKTGQLWKYFDLDDETGKRATCRICSEVVPRLDCKNRDLEKHLATQHNITTKKPEESLMCSICGQHFSSARSRDRHEKIHLEQYRFYCSFCGKGFMEEARKISHERTHTGEMPEECKECGRRFADKARLTSHMKTHTGTGETPFQCPLCLVKFRFLASMNNHICVPPGL